MKPLKGGRNRMKRNYAMRKSLTVLAALAAFAGVAAPAVANEVAAPAETVSVAVEFGDLDLPADAAKLDKRVDTAAGEVCGRPEIRSVSQMAAWEECKAEAKAEALDQISVLEPYQSLALASLF